MFKNVKKALFALVLAFVAAFAFACGDKEEVKEANKENCKEFCETCPTCDPAANKENCKDFCGEGQTCPTCPTCPTVNAETCEKFQNFIAPTDFYVDGDTVEVGKTKEVYVDEDAWDPEDCTKTLVFVSENPAIATVDANGVVTGVRPGKVLIYVYSPLNPELEVDPAEFEVKDSEPNDQKVIDRELDKIISELPSFVAADFELPQPWNTSVEVSYKIGANAVTKLSVADLAEDKMVKLNIELALGDASASYSADIWLVKNANVNTFVMLDSASKMVENYFNEYAIAKQVVLSKSSTAADPDWKCAVAELADADYTGINKLLVTVQGTKGEQIMFKTNDQGGSNEKYVTMTGAPQDLSFDLDITFDPSKFAMVVFCNPGTAGSGHDFIITKMQLAGEKTINLLDANWRGLDEGMYAVKKAEPKKVAADLDLLTSVYGCTISWSSDLATAISAEGKYLSPAEDKTVTLSALVKYGTGSRNLDFVVTAKGFDADEKADLIMANTFAKLEGKEFNTSLALPDFDDTFGAKLSYTSQDTAVYDNTGKLVAAVTEKKDVKFTVKIEYTIASKPEENFTKERELTIKAVPANAASLFLEAALATDAYKKYQSEVHAPWGQTAGNIVFEALPGMVWDVENVKLDARLQDDYQIFSQAEAGAALKLEAQYLRYQLVSIKGTYTKDGASTDIVLFFNIGISETPLNIISAIWRSSAQKDTTLSPEQGKYDIAGNVSYFDKKIGYVTETYGSGYFSGWSVSAVDGEGKTWQTFMMEVLTVYIRENESGVYIDPANVNGGIAGAGGNWGVWYVNTTDKPVNIEVGVYGDTNYHYEEGHATATAIGSRLNIAMDGYALGFVADKDGKIIQGSNNTKLQDGMPDQRAVLGGKAYKAGDKVSEAMFNAMQLDGKADKFEAVYTANDNLLFVQNNEGTFKKVEEEYVAIKEGEEVAAADRFAPTYAKGAALTAEQYAALDAETKALVTVEYKAKEAVNYEVPNLFGDSAKGSVVNYLTIPANGFAMSWKYQFYGVGNPATVYPFCQEGSTLKIEHFQVHPLSSMDAEYATNYVVAAENLLKEPEVNHVSFETNVNAARARYNLLSGDTLADVFPAARLTDLEAQAVAFINADIAALLASEPAADADKSTFAQGLATMWSRLYKTEGDDIVDKLSTQITSKLTKDAFDAKYAEYAAIDLFITYDFNGGYAQGFLKDTDKALLLEDFMADLYAFMVAKGAWADTTAPDLETFKSVGYWSENYAQYAETLLGKYLFTPKVEVIDEADVVHENYHDIIEGTDKFFNSPEGHKYIALMDYVNESTQTANGNGQDAWGRKGENYVPQEWIQRQSYYTSAMVNANLNSVVVTNSGTLLGAYRFAQWVCGTGQTNYKNWIPNNYWSTVFDREKTQKEYTRQVYHCTDITVKLQDTPFKEGYTFLGWKFEDGTDAVITGSMFKNITVKAAWAAGVEEGIEKELNRNLDGVYYGTPAAVDFRANTPVGTIGEQANSTGLGSYAIIAGNKLFLLGQFAGIELGADATEDLTLDTKDSVQPYGTDGYATAFSCGLNTIDGAVVIRNSYGYGALYHNAGQFNITITEVKNTYGRQLDGENFGYQRFLFSFDADKKVYVGTKVSSADGTSVTLKPGDFLWCPMTAERFCTGLTNCNGTSGVEGVWNGVENPEVLIVETAKYLPAADEKFSEVIFFNDNTVHDHQVFVGNATVAVVKPADPKKAGYDFKGWATKPNAAIADVVEVAADTANVKYYAVWEKMERYSEMTVDAAYEGEDLTTFKTLNEALKHVGENCVITVKAGTYADNATIMNSVKIVGPNASRHALDKRLDEAIISGVITIDDDVNNVEISGLKFTGAGQIRTVAGEGADATTINNTGLTFANNIFDKGTDTTAAISLAKGNRYYSKDVVISGSSFTASALVDKAVVYLDNNINLTVKDCKFENMPKNAVGVYDTSNGVGEGGSAIFSGNTFKDITGSAIWLNWASPLADYKATAVFDVFNNYLENVGGAAAIDIEGANANTKYASCNIHHNTFKEVWKCLWLDKVLEGKFNYNKMFTPTKASGYFAKGNSADYAIDCTKNLYLSTDGATVITAPYAAANGAFNNATKGTADTDNFATVAAYEAALLEKYGVVTFEEFENMFFADYKAYLNNTEDDLATFKSNWINKVEGKFEDKVYAANKKGVVDNELATFANSTAWADKYLPVIDAFDEYVKGVNPDQSAWASTWTGYLRIREYFTKNENRKTFARDEMLIAAINKGIENVAKAANLTTVATWNHDATAALECKDLNIWAAANYDNYVFLFTGKTAPTYWYRIYLKEYYNGFYEVVAIKTAGQSGSTDETVSFTILANNATDVAALEALGAKVGDFITIPAEAVASEAKAFDTPINVTLYKKPAE